MTTDRKLRSTPYGRMWRAYLRGTGTRLSADDVFALMMDDAIGSRSQADYEEREDARHCDPETVAECARPPKGKAGASSAIGERQ